VSHGLAMPYVMERTLMLPGQLHAWDVIDRDNRPAIVERTFIECVVSEHDNLCIDVVVHDIEGEALGQCRADARISRNRVRLLWWE
jgi:hypothetical protein